MERKVGAGDTGRFPAPFVWKLWNIMKDEDNTIVSWGCEGKTVVINNTHLFSESVLPKYFKHSNFSSFVSQLNNYGFKKYGWKKCEYKHVCFQRGRKDMLNRIINRKQIRNQQEPYVSESSSCWSNSRVMNAVDQRNQDAEKEMIASFEKRINLMETRMNNCFGKRKTSDMSCSSADHAVVNPELGMEDKNPNLNILLKEIREKLEGVREILKNPKP